MAIPLKTLHQLITIFLLAHCITCQIITLPQPTPTDLTHINLNSPVKLATVPADLDMNTNGYPWLKLQHGFNYVAFDGWTCEGVQGRALQSWIYPLVPDAPPSPDPSMAAAQLRNNLKTFARGKGVKLLVNAFSSFEDPASKNISASKCAQTLSAFIDSYNLDGVNIDFRDREAMKEGKGITWLTVFILSLKRTKDSKVFLSLNAELFDLERYPISNPIPLEIALGSKIDYYIINYRQDESLHYDTYLSIFAQGATSIQQLSIRGIPLNKLIVGKSAAFNSSGFVFGRQLLQWFKTAFRVLGWRGGLAVKDYDWSNGITHLNEAILNRDRSESIMGVNLDTIDNWWPPQKTASDLGVPGHAPTNIYNHFIIGTWTCQKGAFDVAKLWQDVSFYLPHAFGDSDAQIQSYFMDRYRKAGKKVVVRAFGSAQSPTTGQADPYDCAMSLAEFVNKNQLDGVDVNYQDNQAFNTGKAQLWLLSFTKVLRAELPFHLISHSIKNHYLVSQNYPSGGYQKIINQADAWLDFYTILFYGQHQTSFDTYESLFVNSGAQIPQSSVFQLLVRGFRLNKLVIGKPIAQLSSEKGYMAPEKLRGIFLKGQTAYKWRGGLVYSSYLPDRKGKAMLEVMRGMDRDQSIRLAYISNVNTWWPPASTLSQMGVPSLAPPNIYNYFAYAFWTCKEPLAIAKVYGNLTGYMGTQLGADNSATQQYVRQLYKKNKVKLLISAFGASENPTSEGYDPIECADKFAQFIKANEADGVDIDYEDSEAFRNGTGEDWLIRFMSKLRTELPFHIISHAPQGPYFTPTFSNRGAYLTIDRQIGKNIDFYNVQFYNQVATRYDQYETLFVDSGEMNPRSALYQVIASGVVAEKVVLGKPASQTDAYNTGYVKATDLNVMLKKCKKDKINPGWQPNVMFWHFLSDTKGQIVAEVLKDL